MEKLSRKVIPENILLDKTTYEEVGEFLKEFAIHEMKHAADIMERIYLIGGEATTKSDKPVIGNTLSEFAQNGLKAEEEALEHYREIINKSRQIGDIETHELFERIYSEEEKHLFKFQEYVDIIDEPDSPESGHSEWRSIFTPDYFNLLNMAVANEISAIIQYTTQHEKANLQKLRKKSSPLEVIANSNKAHVVSDLLKEVFMQEMEHLEKITERIYLLEGEAVASPDPPPRVGETAEDFIILNHMAENDAILLYRSIIQEALKLGDITTMHLFEEIIKQEEEHYWRFDDYLK